VSKANTFVDKAGWTLNADGIREKKTKNGTTTLAFSISTSDAPELKDVADILKSEWQKIGASVDVKSIRRWLFKSKRHSTTKV
jgi:ABC-type transport system substrate-binding protein